MGESPRVFDFHYDVEVGGVPDDRAVDVYVPLPAEGPYQRILGQSIESTLPGALDTEGEFNNGFYHVTRRAGDATPIRIRMTWRVGRSAAGTGGEVRLSEEEKREYLAPDALVPVSHEILDPILAEVRALRVDDSAAATARAIYDWVVDNVEYKKVGTGWGNGDTFWACSERYGNCTDFHALFISLARSEGIPARFEIGFPVPEDRSSGSVAGYHCWVLFHLPDRGWVPIDASEASKHPERRETFFGSHPPDRIHFTTGRDLVISPATRQEPLNYFVYPHVEVDGRPHEARVVTSFRYREAEAAPVESL